MINYNQIIAKLYPLADCYMKGTDYSDYTAIVWNTTPIPEADLMSGYLTEYRKNRIKYLSRQAYNIIISGIPSSALGYPHAYDTTEEDQINLIGAVTTTQTMYYGSKPYTQGSQVVDVGGAVIGTSLTGLLNDTTVYTASIVIDGITSTISVVGSDAQDYDSLIIKLSTELAVSTTGVPVILNGNLVIQSGSYTILSSTVSITDTDLFSSLTGFISIQVPITGTDGSEQITKTYKLHTHTELLQVLNDGKDIKLYTMQVFNVRRAEVLAAQDELAIDAVIW